MLMTKASAGDRTAPESTTETRGESTLSGMRPCTVKKGSVGSTHLVINMDLRDFSVSYEL